MEDKLRLALDSIGSIKKDDNLCVVQLKEKEHNLLLTFITDQEMGRQLSMRIDGSPAGKFRLHRLLPEVFWE